MYKQIKDIDLFLLDMDGTIYHENQLINGAKEFLTTIRNLGKEYAFMSNNSSKGKSAYVNKLNNLGIEATSKNIISSVTVTISYLESNYRHGTKIYLVGTESLKQEIESYGYEIVPTDYRKDDVELCILGYDTELTYRKIEVACHHLSRGVDYLATNCDSRCPVKDNKFIPDCGAMAKMIEMATNRIPKFLGKPEPEMIFEASRIFNTPLTRIMCIGDRLYTDIAVGLNAGCHTALVLTGEATRDDLKRTDFIPEFVFSSIKDITPHLL